MSGKRIAMTSIVGGLLFVLLPGCASVKFVQRNPLTGEIWTVYEHSLGPDTITYCAPGEAAGCMEAQMVDSPPPKYPTPTLASSQPVQ